MNQTRTFLLFAWALVGFLIWQAWQVDYHTPTVDQAPTAPSANEPGNSELPEFADDASLPEAAPDAPSTAAAGTDPELSASLEEASPPQAPVIVTTDVLRLTIDPRGASIVRAELLNYPETTKRGAPSVELFSQLAGHEFSAQAGWRSSKGISPSHQQLFSSPAESYTLDAGEARIEVPFSWRDETGLELTKTFVFERGSYVIAMQEALRNGSGQSWRGYAYRQMMRQPPPSKGGGMTNPEAYSFVGAAWYSPSEKFNKLTFDDIDPKEPLDAAGQGGWIAMLQHYFFAAWIPDPSEASRFGTAVVQGRYFIRTAAPVIEIASGETQESTTRLYVGPKLQEHLAGVAPGLELTIDYGILTTLAEPMFWLLSFFHTLTGNWGWAIILLVLVIKAAFFKLSEAQYKSFAKMRAVQPRIEALKERYGEDKQKFNMAMMELYKKEKINPMGGCLPILVQIPVFISLYWVLLESVELRHAPWILWLSNLSAPDPYFVLPVLNLLTMWFTQKLSPSPGMDPMQKKIMTYMPLVFGVMFAFFPAGLVLYWTVNGGLGLLQQWYINKRHGGPVAKAA
ncbi:MAG: membrane protein insertase YidC [Pseudomarimonas sp.]